MKKQIKKLTSIMFAVSLILCIIGCKKEPEFNILDYVYTVSFESNGGTEIDSQTVVLGETVEKPVDPVHTENPETEKFAGWYTDKDTTKKYDFSAKVESSFTLYAKWVHEHKVTEEIAKLEHTHKFAPEWKSDETNHWHAATCGCPDVELQKTEHTFGDWITTIEPTCTQEGKKTVYCTVCEYEKEETIPAKGHTLGIWKITDEPTETEVGKMQSVCEVCVLICLYMCRENWKNIKKLLLLMRLIRTFNSVL